MKESDDVPVESTETYSPDELLGSRPAIMFVAIVFGIIAGLSVIGFLFNLTINYPGTGRPVIVVDPLWMMGHVIRGFGLGILTYRMWLYQAELKRWHGRATEEFARAHASVWKTGALVLGVLIVYSITYVAVGGPSR
jgi:voltage-gated potassium channel Kch